MSRPSLLVRKVIGVRVYEAFFHFLKGFGRYCIASKCTRGIISQQCFSLIVIRFVGFDIDRVVRIGAVESEAETISPTIRRRSRQMNSQGAMPKAFAVLVLLVGVLTGCASSTDQQCAAIGNAEGSWEKGGWRRLGQAVPLRPGSQWNPILGLRRRRLSLEAGASRRFMVV